MAHLINKSALVAEIERLKNADLSHLSGEQVNIYLNTLDLVETAICTLEVKDVNLEKEIQMFSMELAMKENNGDWEKDIAVTARHFFELGLKVAQKNE